MNTTITEDRDDERGRNADGGFSAIGNGMSAPGTSSRWQEIQMPAVRGELDAYYAGFPTNLSALEAALHEIYAQHPGWSPFRMKAVGYELMAEHCPVKVFRQFPFYFEIDVSKPRTDLGSGGIGGWIRGTPFAEQLTDQGNVWHGTCGARGLSWGWPVMDDNHLCLGNDVVFEFGLNGLIQQAEARQARASSDNEREFLDAVIAGNRALLRIAERFAAEAARMLAGENDPAVCARLARIAQTAVRVPGEPPETFFEAVNTLLFMRETVQSLEGSGISMLGHLDRILWPFYEREVACGTLTRDGAKELLACLLIFPATRFDLHANGNHVGTNISVGIGGCDADGRPVFNALTEIILEIYREQRLIDPKLHARGGRYEASLFAFRSFTDFGEKTGATPDGRRAGEYLSAGMGPSLSAMTKDASIGQVLRAIEPLDLRDYPVVAVLDLKLPATPGSFPPAILVPVIQRFVAAGGSVLQMNVVNPEVLREAKAHPELHPDLAVRISGYSAYFTTLPENVQDEVINRTDASI